MWPRTMKEGWADDKPERSRLIYEGDKMKADKRHPKNCVFISSSDISTNTENRRIRFG